MTDPSVARTPWADGEATEPDLTLLALLLAHQRQAWRRGERAPVETYLAQQHALQADDELVLDLIYNEIMLREEAGETPRLEEYRGRFPHLAPQLALQFEVEGALSPEAMPRGWDDVTMPAAGPPRPAEAGRPAVAGYEILGELGRGGMAVVYKARQLRLNRIVALKMILAGDHAGPEDAIRFLAEAEAVARLQHPHIVQIYSLGDHRGHPYFEMEYAAGGSLADSLDGTPWPAEDAARLLQTLALAIHEVHRLGIVHRDLKPANILLTADGTPKVADFGLAKWLDVEPGLTRSTRIVGSPSYMAPEQAGSRDGPIGPAADVYALGAILYELLTGRRPFRAATVLETLEQVKWAEPVPPRSLRPRLHRDLATICLKCLEKEPSRRDASAADLAEDLGRFRAGQTIRARPVSGTERLGRWCRREPRLAGLALGLIAALVGVATQWWRAESHLEEARGQRQLALAGELRQVEANRVLRLANDREVTARRRAQERFDAALAALGGFEAITNDPALLREPHLQGLRRKLLDTALGFYRELQASLEEDASPDARSQLSAAYGRVADISWELGLQDEALATHRRALALIERKAESVAEAASPEILAQEARCHTRIGFDLRVMGRPAEALWSYEKAREIQEPLARDNPADPHLREVLSWTLSNLGLIQQDLGRLGDAIRLHRQAIAIHEALVDRHPDMLKYRSDLAWCGRNLSLALTAAGDPDEALRLDERAAEVHEALVAADRGDAEFRWRLAKCLDEVGRIHLMSGRPADAAGPLDRAAGLYEGLVRVNPLKYRGDLDRNRLYLAPSQAKTGLVEEAMASVRRAEDLLSTSSSVPPGTLYDLACSYSLWSAAGPGEGPTPAAREARAGRAMAALRRAVTAGYDDLARIRRDPALDPLRPRRDFQELIMDLALPADPFPR